MPTTLVLLRRRVREALADLPAEEADELTEGLEADLAESYAEDLRRELPDPVAELRLAAGLPAPASRRPSVRTAWRDTAADVRRRLRSSPATSAVLDFLGSLRPVWWVVRGLVAAGWLIWLSGRGGMPVPQTLGEWTTTLVLVVLSVQTSRGRWRASWLRGALVVANVVAALALLPLLQHLADETLSWEEASWYDGSPGAGLQLDGEPVVNVFAYDAQGEPIRDVQLFDQDGDPLTVPEDLSTGHCIDEECLRAGAYRPRTAENGLAAWNVFPLRILETGIDESGMDSPLPGAVPQDVQPPLLKVPALAPLPPTAKSDVEPPTPSVADINR